MVIEIFDIVFDMSPTKLSSHRTGIVTCTETHELIQTLSILPRIGTAGS